MIPKVITISAECRSNSSERLGIGGEDPSPQSSVSPPKENPSGDPLKDSIRYYTSPIETSDTQRSMAISIDELLEILDDISRDTSRQTPEPSRRKRSIYLSPSHRRPSQPGESVSSVEEAAAAVTKAQHDDDAVKPKADLTTNHRRQTISGSCRRIRESRGRLARSMSNCTPMPFLRDGSSMTMAEQKEELTALSRRPTSVYYC